MKKKIIYISECLSKNNTVDEATESVSSEFIDELNRGRLTIPSFSAVFFVWNPYSESDSDTPNMMQIIPYETATTH